MRPVIHVLDNLAQGGCQTCLRALAGYPNKARRHFFFSLRRQQDEIVLPAEWTQISRSTSRFSLIPYFELQRFQRQLGPAILHCHLFKSQVFGQRLKSLDSHCRLIFHEGGRISGREHEPKWESMLYRRFLRQVSPSVDQFIANSRETLRHLMEAGIRPATPGVVVYNSILDRVEPCSNSQRQRVRAASNLPTDAIVFGFAGRLIERKGWREFLECALHFRDRSDLFWVIAGSGPEGPLLERLIREHGLTRVRLLGFQSDMTLFYQSIDLCIVPSHWEPHGLVQIEAQGHGVPVLATDVPGMAETLDRGESALFFAPKDVPAMIRQIKRWLESPELRAQLIPASLENARRFTVRNYHDQLEAIYTELESR